MAEHEDQVVAPSTVMRRKARQVFGDVVYDDVNQSANSLYYSPSPYQSPSTKKGEKMQSFEKPVATTLFQQPEKRDDSVVTVTTVMNQNENNNDDKENYTPQQQQQLQFADGNKNETNILSKDSVLSSAAAMRSRRGSVIKVDLLKKTQEAINKANISVNETLNAARKAKHKAIRKKAIEHAKVKNQWKEENRATRLLNKKMQESRLIRLKVERQISSKYSQAKASKYQQERLAKLEEVDKESKFKSEISREHRAKLVEQHRKQRKQSLDARARLRENHRKGEEKIQLMRIEEDKAIFDERQLASVAQREMNKCNAEARRKSFQFRNGDARRIRELHNKMECERKDQEHNSFELKVAGDKDAEQYKKDLAEHRRNSLAFRNKIGREQREKKKMEEMEERDKEHESFELKAAANRDVDAFNKRLAAERRESLASRNRAGRQQRKNALQQKIDDLVAEHSSYELKWDGDRDAQEHKKRLEEARRNSLAHRNQEARSHREFQNQQKSLEMAKEHESFELKIEGERDAQKYLKEMEKARRDSLALRNKESKRREDVETLQRARALAESHEGYELKWAGEKDAEEYSRKMEQQKRESLANRNAERARQASFEKQSALASLGEEIDSLHLKWAGEKDAKDYQKLKEQQKRDSLAFRNAERARQANVEQEFEANARKTEVESLQLKWAGDDDAKAYLAQLEEERRQSLKFRGQEHERHRKLKEELYHEKLGFEHESYELKWAGEKDAEEYQRQLQYQRRDSFAARNAEKVRHAKVMEELRSIAREKETESLIMKWAGEDDGKAYLAQLEEQRRRSLQSRGEEVKRRRKLEEELHSQELQKCHEDEQLKAECQKDVEAYKKQCADINKASLRFARKEAQLQRLEEEKELNGLQKTEEENFVLETLARSDVEGYLDDCKRRRRLSLVSRAKEKRRHAAWKRDQEEKQRQEISRDVRNRAMDSMYVELARQEERAQIAMDALQHAGCTFSVNPFSGLLDYRL